MAATCTDIRIKREPGTCHTDTSDETVADPLESKVEGRPSQQASLCEVCIDEPSKYTCPGCGLKTCSLPCVKEHKIKLDCDGQRNKFAWVDKSQYSDRHLLNDYRFLENAERSLYSNKIVPRNRFTGLPSHNRGSPYHHSKRSKILMSAAVKRGIRLRVMSDNMERHKLNTSFYTIKSDLIEWHIEWHFVASNCLVRDEKVPESTILLQAVKKFGNPVDFPHLRKPLEDYRKRFRMCRYLIKAEGLPANRRRYIEIKPSLTLADNLKGLSLVEHPTILVLPPSYSSDDFPLLDKDNDLVHMHPAHLRHLTSTNPNYSKKACLETQLLDLTSSVYTPESDHTKSKPVDEEVDSDSSSPSDVNYPGDDVGDNDNVVVKPVTTPADDVDNVVCKSVTTPVGDVSDDDNVVSTPATTSAYTTRSIFGP